MSKESQISASSTGMYISPDNKKQDNISIEEKKIQEIQSKYPNMYKVYEGWTEGMTGTTFDEFSMDFGHPGKNIYRTQVINTLFHHLPPETREAYKNILVEELNQGDIDPEQNLGGELDRTKIDSILSQVTLPKNQFSYTKTEKGDDGEPVEFGAIQLDPKTGALIEVKNPRTAKNVLDHYLKNNTPHISQELMFFNPEKLFTDGQWTPENTGYWGGATDGSRTSSSNIFSQFRSQNALAIGDISITPDSAVTLPDYIYEGVKQLGKENGYITDDLDSYREALESGKLDPHSNNFIAGGYDFYPEVIKAYGRSLKDENITSEEEGLIDEKVERLIQEYAEEIQGGYITDQLIDDGYLIYDITNQQPVDRPMTNSDFFNQSYENWRSFDVQHTLKKYGEWYDANPVKGLLDNLWGSTRTAFEPWSFGLINYLEKSSTEEINELVLEIEQTNPELFNHLFGENSNTISNLHTVMGWMESINHLGAFIYYAGKARPYLQPGGTAFTATRTADVTELVTQSKIAEGITFGLFGAGQNILNPEIQKSVDQHMVDFGLSFLLGYHFPAMGRLGKDLRFSKAGEGVKGTLKDMGAFLAQSKILTGAGMLEAWTAQTYETAMHKIDEGMDTGNAFGEAASESLKLFNPFGGKEARDQWIHSAIFMTALHAYGLLPSWSPIFKPKDSQYHKKGMMPSKEYHDHWLKSFERLNTDIAYITANIKEDPSGVPRGMLNKDGTLKEPTNTHERLLLKNFWQEKLIGSRDQGIEGLFNTINQLIIQNPNVKFPQQVTTKKVVMQKDGLPGKVEIKQNYIISEKDLLDANKLEMLRSEYKEQMNKFRNDPKSIDYEYLNTVESTLLHYMSALKEKSPGANIIDSELVLDNRMLMRRKAGTLKIKDQEFKMSEILSETHEFLDPNTHRLIKQWEVQNAYSIKRSVGDIILESNGQMYVNPALPATLKEMLKVAGYTTRDNFQVRTPDGEVIFINKGDIHPPKLGE